MAGLEIKIMPSATKDLEQIQFYLEAKAGAGKAEEVVEAILDRCNSLATSPNLGRRRDEIADGVRGVTESSYIIYYIVEGQIVAITRVIHGSRDVKAYFE